MSCVQSLPEVTSEEETENDVPDEKAVTPSKPSRKSSGSLIPQSRNLNKKRRESGSLTKFVEEVEVRFSEAEKTSNLKPPSHTTKKANGTPDEKATAAGNGTKTGKANPRPLANTTNSRPR